MSNVPCPLHVPAVPAIVQRLEITICDGKWASPSSTTRSPASVVDLSQEDRRLVWPIVDGPYAHHNGVAQVLAGEDGATRFVWTADLLPNELAEITSEQMERGIETVKQTLEAGA